MAEMAGKTSRDLGLHSQSLNTLIIFFAEKDQRKLNLQLKTENRQNK